MGQSELCSASVWVRPAKPRSGPKQPFVCPGPPLHSPTAFTTTTTTTRSPFRHYAAEHIRPPPQAYHVVRCVQPISRSFTRVHPPSAPGRHGCARGSSVGPRAASCDAWFCTAEPPIQHATWSTPLPVVGADCCVAFYARQSSSAEILGRFGSIGTSIFVTPKGSRFKE